ncbi:hypothetical protein BMS3Bbin13_00024 [bacterium BMS3Bbin13]|nr:hypothetical protein BMS3Bbin13_00024 [bacterium BMS3Bbin13]
MEGLRERWGRLLDRLLDGGVLPFVGAGISYAARVPGPASCQPTPGWMCERLRQALDEDLPPGDRPKISDPAAVLWVLRHGTCSSSLASRAADRRCHSRRVLRHDACSLSLGWLAELGALLWGSREVCEVLQIDRFAELEPLPVHRYLAYLAREGLITEIISTNYDCCIETAFRRSFGEEAVGAAAVAVIRNLEEYRRHAGKRYVKGPGGVRRPVLHLFKINGCAEAYRRDRQQALSFPTVEHDCAWHAAAERIILTERQLQNFRSERWAEELFRDRARCHNLLFCGFGSEEPQIRHAALALISEFHTDNAGCAALTPQATARLPNAPFIVAYRVPTYYQIQILAAFVQAHCGPIGRGLGPVQVAGALLHNVFQGADAAADPGDETAKLDADAFFRALFEDAFLGLLERALGQQSVLFVWLRELTHLPKSWLQAVTGQFSPPPPPSPPRCALVPSSRRPISQALLDPISPGKPLPLWQWLWAMRYPERAERPPADWYLPLEEDPLLLPLTLVLLCSLASDVTESAPVGHPQPVANLGLRVDARCPAGSGVPPVPVYLIEEGVSLPWAGPLRGRLVRHIAVPSARAMDLSGRWVNCTEDPAGTKHLLVGRRDIISAKDIVQIAVKPVKMAGVLCDVFAAARPKPAARLTRRHPPGA